jgi:GT2 family glycosyltransferase
LDSLVECTATPFHVFVVDNGSRDADTVRRLDDWSGRPEVTLFRLPENTGPAAGRNVALAELGPQFDVVAMLDNDIVALPGWDGAALAALGRGADLIQPKLLEADRKTLERGPNRPNASPLAVNPSFLGRGTRADCPEWNTEEEAEIAGTATVMRRSVLDRIGPLDSRLQIGEDFDYSFRARAAGFAIRYVPTCAMVHDHGFDYRYDQERSRVDKYLIAHVILWQRWGKALLSPCYLRWYSWLHFANEPMYLPEDQRWRIAHRRLRRRLVRVWIMRRHANYWTVPEVLANETERLARRLGMTA